jgi:hypothetical protein
MSSLLVFNRIYRLEIQSVMLVFSTQLLTITLIPSLLFTSPLSKVKVHYIQTVCGRGWEVLICVGDLILQEFNTLYLTRFRTYKIALPPEKKT